MFTITTTQHSRVTDGATRVTAKGHGKQRTTGYNPALSVEANHASAVGALLDTLASDEQKAKVRHPSGAQRVRNESVSDGGGKYRWTIDV